ncbi:hypothetical protein [Thiohalophilus sp.]|nr:hypothetical protein [Thiohalophilus sp.]MDZ7661516.1 hypothetical protein [Thiohalophilus sp.]
MRRHSPRTRLKRFISDELDLLKETVDGLVAHVEQLKERRSSGI